MQKEKGESKKKGNREREMCWKVESTIDNEEREETKENGRLRFTRKDDRTREERLLRT